LKHLFIRILQVTWVLSILAIAATTFAVVSASQDIIEVLTISIFLVAFLIIVQYLVLASLNPSKLFNESKRRYFILFVIVIFSASVIGGVASKFYKDYEYNKKLEAGSDTAFFDEILNDTINNYNLTECNDIDQIPDASKKDLQAAALDLKNHKVNGLNILVKIAEQDDALGRRFRCLINEDVDIEEIAEAANVKY